MKSLNDTLQAEQSISSEHSREPLQLARARANSHERRRSRDVNVRLELRYADNKIGEDRVRLRAYNGKLVGPVIEACPGDTLNIFLDNQLPEDPNPGSDEPNAPHGFNITNLHVHGLHVSPAGNSDNVLMAVGPGQQFQYEIKIPSDHPAGTYWYHPHKHGSVALQLANSLAGALIIRGDIDKVEEIEQAEERIFVFQQIPYVLDGEGIGRVETYDNFGPLVWASLGRRITLNGEVEPILKMKPGEVQRWRFIHAGIREQLRLRLVKRDPDSGAEVPLSQYQIALDGITTGRIEEVKETELFPGYRVDVMVRAADGSGKELPEGTYWLVDEASPPTSRDLARIVVKGKKVKMRLPKEKDLALLAPFKPIRDDELTGTQEARFDIDITKTPPLFTVNGKPFDPHAPPRQLKLEAVEEWIVSSSQIAGHPFHIHVNPFQFTRPDGTIVWKDTLFVPAGGSVRLRTRYKRYIGRFMLHCHILDHEDRGMMETLEIIPPRNAHEHPPH